MTEPAPLSLIPRGRAWLLTGGLVLAALGVAQSDPGPGASGRSLAVLVLLVVASGAWLAWVWVPPGTIVAEVVLVVFAVSGGLLTAAAPNGPSSAFAFVAVVSAGVRYGGTRPIVVMLLSAVSLIGATIAYDGSATGVAAYCFGLLAAMLAAANRRTSLLRAEEAELLLAQIQRSREEGLRSAALGERARIAREIHDVLAHSLAGLTIDLEATRMLVEQGASPDRVLSRVDRAHTLAREGLLETRRAIEALRGDTVDTQQQLSALVDALRDGTEFGVTLQIDGAVDDRPADVALALVRVTQESLTNVRKHAPGSAVRVAVTREATRVVLRVRDDGDRSADRPASGSVREGALAASGGGYGLVGMRERAEILGGTLSAGSTDDGGWLVELMIPLEAVAR